jgi:hypothetical protein
MMPLLALLLSAAPVENASLPRLVVLDLQHQGGATEAEAQALDDALVQALSQTRLFQVASQRDIAAVLGLERQRQLLGCSEESSCLAELSGALDARLVVSGTLNRVGGTYQLTLQSIDPRKAQPVGRSLRSARTFEDVRAMLPWAVADATGTPAPKAPSRVLPTGLIIVGGLALAVTGFLAFNVETREQAIVRELGAAQPVTALPHTAGDYAAEATDITRQKNWALLFGLAGGVVGGLGLLWYLRVPDASGGQVALLPTGNGAALVGSF